MCIVVCGNRIMCQKVQYESLETWRNPRCLTFANFLKIGGFGRFLLLSLIIIVTNNNICCKPAMDEHNRFTSHARSNSNYK